MIVCLICTSYQVQSSKFLHLCVTWIKEIYTSPVTTGKFYMRPDFSRKRIEIKYIKIDVTTDTIIIASELVIVILTQWYVTLWHDERKLCLTIRFSLINEWVDYKLISSSLLWNSIMFIFLNILFIRMSFPYGKSSGGFDSRKLLYKLDFSLQLKGRDELQSDSLFRQFIIFTAATEFSVYLKWFSWNLGNLFEL